MGVDGEVVFADFNSRNKFDFIIVSRTGEREAKTTPIRLKSWVLIIQLDSFNQSEKQRE